MDASGLLALLNKGTPSRSASGSPVVDKPTDPAILATSGTQTHSIPSKASSASEKVTIHADRLFDGSLNVSDLESVSRLKRTPIAGARNVIAVNDRYLSYSLSKPGDIRVIELDNVANVALKGHLKSPIVNLSMIDSEDDFDEDDQSTTESMILPPSRLVSTTADNEVIFWHVIPVPDQGESDGGVLTSPDFRQILRITPDPNAKTLAKLGNLGLFVVSVEDTLYVYNLDTLEDTKDVLQIERTPSGLSYSSYVCRSTNPIVDFDVSSDGSAVVTINSAGTIELWSSSDFRSSSAKKPLTNAIASLASKASYPPSSVQFFNQPDPAFPARCILAGFANNSVLQLYHLGSLSLVQEVALPDFSEIATPFSEFLSPLVVSSANRIAVVVNKVRNSLIFLVLGEDASEDESAKVRFTQAQYIERASPGDPEKHARFDKITELQYVSDAKIVSMCSSRITSETNSLFDLFIADTSEVRILPVTQNLLGGGQSGKVDKGISVDSLPSTYDSSINLHRSAASGSSTTTKADGQNGLRSASTGVSSPAPVSAPASLPRVKSSEMKNQKPSSVPSHDSSFANSDELSKIIRSSLGKEVNQILLPSIAKLVHGSIHAAMGEMVKPSMGSIQAGIANIQEVVPAEISKLRGDELNRVSSGVDSVYAMLRDYSSETRSLIQELKGEIARRDRDIDELKTLVSQLSDAVSRLSVSGSNQSYSAAPSNFWADNRTRGVTAEVGSGPAPGSTEGQRQPSLPNSRNLLSNLTGNGPLSGTPPPSGPWGQILHATGPSISSPPPGPTRAPISGAPGMAHAPGYGNAYPAQSRTASQRMGGGYQTPGNGSLPESYGSGQRHPSQSYGFDSQDMYQSNAPTPPVQHQGQNVLYNMPLSAAGPVPVAQNARGYDEPMQTPPRGIEPSAAVAPVSTLAPPPPAAAAAPTESKKEASSELADNVIRVDGLLRKGENDEALSAWIEAPQDQQEVLFSVLSAYRPGYVLTTDNQLLLLAVVAGLGSFSESSQFHVRIEWLDCALRRIEANDPTIQDMVVQVLGVVEKKVEEAAQSRGLGPEVYASVRRVISGICKAHRSS
ncbi:hypothetical protein CANCADRAFT_31705 [Tortispora caseinolytica NRRL Y-17796]|uniref:EDC4-like protein pdc1 beta-propeller domain-containing protein n=1 Tax=Tortispora caseinolytica NRRL Y-17796 TaxID=767744 RepID=A0A1E4TGH1_9ASCO|nr:hypothetical protein CANCADRAFT_31705 [Tortispora caseinolytica NRRL Y-17796]